MKLTQILLSAAAGAAVALYFTTESGKKLLEGFTDRYNDKIDSTAENLKNSVDKVEEKIKNTIDHMADKIHAGSKNLADSHL